VNNRANILELRRDTMQLILDPHRGGAIREFNWGAQAILRPTAANAGDDPLDIACFPMVPYVNRIARGRFSFGGRAVRLRRNWDADPHPLHGQGWRASWAVVTASASSATVRFDGGEDEWPWRYRCEQRFELLPDGLSIELSIANCGVTTMPAMLGLHPYFPDPARALLQARLPRVWLTDRAALPVEQAATPSEWGFDAPRAVNELPLDHCFSGWDGSATLRWPDRTVSMRASHCGHLHVYTPAGRDFFCLEPQTAAVGALTRDTTEVAAVAPGKRFAIQVQLLVGAS
jgi:aldose 1-epimerase